MNVCLHQTNTLLKYKKLVAIKIYRLDLAENICQFYIFPVAYTCKLPT